MIDICGATILTTTVSLALIFVLFITGAYKRSISTSIYVVSVAAAMQTDNAEAGTIIIVFGAAIALLRAMLLGGEDKLLRGR